MPIPDDVRRQAKDAVSHHETTAQIRAFQNSGIDAAPDFTPVDITPQADAPYGPLTDDIRQQAKDAVSHSETLASIGQMEQADFHGDSVSPGHTPSAKNTMIAERIAEMHKMGQDVGAIQQAMTKDNFGREHELG